MYSVYAMGMIGTCTEERSGSTKRKLLLNTIELFRNNGITLGKNVMRVELDKSDFSVEEIKDIEN